MPYTPRRPTVLLLPWIATASVVWAACGPSAEPGANPEALPVYELSAPTLEIGVIEGDAAYSFADVESVRGLDGGAIAVSDAGNTRISIFGSDGAFLRSWGGRGEGPGEFRTLSRLYRLGPDSLMAADQATARLSVFDLDGRLSRQFDAVTISRDSTFRLDSWLYGRFWIDGALSADDRSRVRRTLDRVPPPRTAPGFRAGLVTRDGSVWIREPDGAGPDGTTSWTRLAEDGSPTAVVESPAAFTPMDVVGDEVLGRWLGRADVHFVRRYDLVQTGETRPAPAWMRTSTVVAAAAPPSEEEFLELMRSSIRGMAMAQERHYADAFSYTTALDSLDFDLPEGLGVAFTHADPRGWAAVFVHPTADRICGLAYGLRVPPGWQAGGIECGPSATPPAQEP